MKPLFQALIAILRNLLLLDFKSSCNDNCVQGRQCTCTPDAKTNQDVIWMKNEKN